MSAGTLAPEIKVPEYEDILDGLGRTPREFGWVQVHVDPVVRNAAGGAVVTVWLQAAYEPGSGGTLKAMTMAGEVGRFALPALQPGQAVKWLLPLWMELEAESVQFLVEASVPPKATRVRPAWKLHGDQAARAAQAGLNASVVPRAIEPPQVPSVESVWRPGQPPPRAAAPGSAPPARKGGAQEIPKAWVEPKPKGGVRRCIACGFEGALAEYERERSCPSCGAPWS